MPTEFVVLVNTKITSRNNLHLMKSYFGLSMV